MSGQSKFNRTDWENISAQQKHQAIIDQIAQLGELDESNWNQWQLQTFSNELGAILKDPQGIEALFPHLLVFWTNPGYIQTALAQSLSNLSDDEFNQIAKVYQEKIKALFFDIYVTNDFSLLQKPETQPKKFYDWQEQPLEQMLLAISDNHYQKLNDAQKVALSKFFQDFHKAQADSLFGTTPPDSTQYQQLPTWQQKEWVDFLIKESNFIALTELKEKLPTTSLFFEEIESHYEEALTFSKQNQALASKLVDLLTPAQKEKAVRLKAIRLSKIALEEVDELNNMHEHEKKSELIEFINNFNRNQVTESSKKPAGFSVLEFIKKKWGQLTAWVGQLFSGRLKSGPKENTLQVRGNHQASDTSEASDQDALNLRNPAVANAFGPTVNAIANPTGTGTNNDETLSQPDQRLQPGQHV